MYIHFRKAFKPSFLFFCMKRKLVKQGAATMMISLPSKWIQANELKKGDEIDIEETGNDLHISLDEKQKKLETSLKLISLTETSIRTLITNTYRAGYDKINIEFENNEQFKILKKVIETRLIGFEITKKQSKSCIVENITEPSSDQFDNILNKMFMNIEELFEITKKRLQGEKTEDFEDIANIIQKYDNFCRRVIIKRKLTENRSEMFWSFLSLIIHGQRELYYLNKSIKKIKASKEQQELLEGAYEIFKILEKTYKEKNISLLNKIHEMQKQLIYKKGYSLLNKPNSIITYHLMASIREFYQANSPLSGLLM